MSKSYTAIRQNWYEHEYEPGWGVSDRPDGFSLHVSKEKLKTYLTETEERNKDQSPSGYHLSFHPSGESKLIVITKKQHTELAKKGSLRVWKHQESEWKFPES